MDGLRFRRTFLSYKFQHKDSGQSVWGWPAGFYLFPFPGYNSLPGLTKRERNAYFYSGQEWNIPIPVPPILRLFQRQKTTPQESLRCPAGPLSRSHSPGAEGRAFPLPDPVLISSPAKQNSPCVLPGGISNIPWNRIATHILAAFVFNPDITHSLWTACSKASKQLRLTCRNCSGERPSVYRGWLNCSSNSFHTSINVTRLI